MLSESRIGCAGVLLLSIGFILQAHVVTLTPSKDNTLYQDDAGALSNGKGTGIFVGRNASDTLTRRALLAFGVSRVVPSGSIVHSVSLTLHMARGKLGAQAVALHKLDKDWGEGDSLAGRGGGGGAPPSQGDTTWLHRFFDRDLWAMPGGDFAPQPSAVVEVNEVGYYTWGSTAAMVADLQGWLDNPAGNSGWILIGNEEQSRTSKRFSSREASEATQRPMLTINFTPAAGCQEQVAADLNNDCRVDFADLGLLAAQWLTDSTSSRRLGTIEIEGVGVFEFDPGRITTVRSDIFKPGHFSVFDILVLLGKQGLIDLDFRFVPEMNTHVIDAIDGKKHWWYVAYYDGGWLEDNVFRMDHFPYKDRMFIRIMRDDSTRLADIYAGFLDEIERRQQNDAHVIVPSVRIRGRTFEERFENVEVTPHNLRDDTFQEGVITAIDIIISLADQGKITYDLQWYDSIGTADIVRSYWVERINSDQASGACGFVYETGLKNRFVRSNHIHIPSDWRVINSPEYGLWFWIELGPCN